MCVANMATKGLLTSEGGGAGCVFWLKQGDRQSQNVSAVDQELPTTRESSVGSVLTHENLVTPREYDLAELCHLSIKNWLLQGKSLLDLLRTTKMW